MLRGIVHCRTTLVADVVIRSSCHPFRVVHFGRSAIPECNYGNTVILSLFVYAAEMSFDVLVASLRILWIAPAHDHAAFATRSTVAAKKSVASKVHPQLSQSVIIHYFVVGNI